MQRITPKIEIVTKKTAPMSIEFDCPVCGNEITFTIDPKSEDPIDFYCDASEDGDHLVKCGVCTSILKWTLPSPSNPSRRK